MTQEYEKISALVDGEAFAGTEDKASFSNKVSSDPQLRAKWKSYHLTRDLMRNDMSSDIGFDISKNVAKALESELAIVAPKPNWKDTPFVAAVIPIVQQGGQLAMVACVTAMVIFGFQTYNKPEVSDPFMTAPSAIGPQGTLAPVSLATGANTEQDRKNNLIEQQRQINALFQDHLRQQKLQNVLDDNIVELEIVELESNTPDETDPNK